MVFTSASAEANLTTAGGSSRVEIVVASADTKCNGSSSSCEEVMSEEVDSRETDKVVESHLMDDDGDDDKAVIVPPLSVLSGVPVRRNWSSASIVSAGYKMMRNGSVSSSRRRLDELNNEEKVPLGSPQVFHHDEETAVPVVYDQLGPPDGGWGWMVLLGTVIVNTLIPGLIKSFGVFFVEFITVFQATPSSVAWIPALTFSLYNLLGPVASAVSMKYSCRFATMLGGLSATLGLALSYFANSIEYLYFSYGILGGIGAGMSYTPGILIIGQYFNKRRGLANGICASGSALGSMILPPFLNYLLSEYGCRGTILILCGLLMNVCVGAALYQPVEWHLKKVPRVLTASSSVEVNGNHHFGTNNTMDNGLKSFVDSSEVTSSMSLKSRPITSSIRRPQSNPRFLPGLSAAAEEGDMDADEITTTASSVESSVPAVSFTVGAGPSPQYVGLGMGSTSSSLAPVTLGVHRSPSVVSTISSSSFAYLSTIYHGSTPAAYQLNQIATGGHRDSLQTSTFGSQIVGRCHCEPTSKCTCATSKKLSLDGGVIKVTNEKMSTWKMIFDVALLKNTVFLLITYTVVASGIGYTNLLIMLPAYATSLGMDKAESSGLLSVVAGADLVGRIGGAWMSDLMSFPCKYLYMAGFVTSGVALLLMPNCTTFAGLATFCAIFGLASGIYIGLMAVLLVNHLGAEKLGTSFGLSLAINGIVMITGPPIFAFILESMGRYDTVIVILGIIILSGGLIFLLEPMANEHEQRKLLTAKLNSGTHV